MKKRIVSLIMVMMIVMSMVGVNVVSADEAVKITIVHTNDTHARIEEGKYAGMGLAKVATKVAELRAENPNLLLLDAGDTFHGQTIATLVKGESITKVMNTMAYDVMTAGNHDFNYGQERLVELDGMTNFPVLAANVKKADGSRLLSPYVIKEVAGLKVGIFGLASPETTYKTHPNNVKGLTFTDPVEESKAMVAELKDQTDIIIALAHIGIDEETIVKSTHIAEQVEGIDLIVDGHSHTTLDEGMLVNGTLIVQAGEHDKALGIVDLEITDGAVSTVKARLFTKDEAAELAEDEAVLSVITEVKAANEVITSVEVGTATFNLDGDRGQVRAGETNLGNLITDAMIAETGADIAFTNGGGIRSSIEPGTITKGDVITVLPFGNYVVVKNMTGADVKAALEHGIQSYPETKGAFPHVAGLTFTFDAGKPVGSKLTEVKVAGVAIDDAKLYEVATNDFIAAGGDGYDVFADDSIVAEYDGLDEILINYIAAHGTAGAKVDGRVTAIEAPVVVAPVVEAPVTTQPATGTTYVVVSGDLLWKIAKKHNVAWESIAQTNNLANPNMIFPGQQLVIPAQ